MKIDGLRHVRATLDDLLDAMDDVQQSCGSGDRRREARHSYRRQITVDVCQPGGSRARFVVATRSFSTTGISFLHGGFLHPGTVCSMELTTLDNAWKAVEATVVHCRLVRGRVHEVGAKFSRPPEVSEFVGEWLQGTILLLDDAPDFAALTSHHLSRSWLTVQVIDRGLRAIKRVKERVVDLVITELDMPGLDGLTVIRRLREEGVDVPIIVLTTDVSEGIEQRVLEAGGDMYLTKPIERDHLIEAVRQLLTPPKPLVSEFARHPDMAQFIDAFLTGLPGVLRDLRTAFQQTDAAALTSLVRRVKSIAGGTGGCGFDPISVAAAEIEAKLRGTPDWPAVGTGIKNLKSLCRRAMAAKRPCHSTR